MGNLVIGDVAHLEPAVSWDDRGCESISLGALALGTGECDGASSSVLEREGGVSTYAKETAVVSSARTHDGK